MLSRSLLHRSDAFAAHVRVASQQNLAAPAATDEVLSFGSYPFGNSSFQPHASLMANGDGNGTLNVKAANVALTPTGGNASIGSGQMLCASVMHLKTCVIPLLLVLCT